jgi:hypothetical protein
MKELVSSLTTRRCIVLSPVLVFRSKKNASRQRADAAGRPEEAGGILRRRGQSAS